MLSNTDDHIQEGWRKGRVIWYDFYPVDKNLFSDARSDPDNILPVDVAGGHGYDLNAFKMRFPKAVLLVLQDLPPAIDNIKELHPEIMKMKYDSSLRSPSR
ncbi:hypothetical protein MMC21_004962 [Puttea exsequens]|nr:hypothetical protein [Puttea exsequens]